MPIPQCLDARGPFIFLFRSQIISSGSSHVSGGGKFQFISFLSSSAPGHWPRVHPREAPTGSWSSSGASLRSRTCDAHVLAPHGTGEGRLPWSPGRVLLRGHLGAQMLVALFSLNWSRLYFVSGWSFCLLPILWDHVTLTCYSDSLALVYRHECCPPNFIPVLEPVENVAE